MERREVLMEMMEEAGKAADIFATSDNVSLEFKSIFSSLEHACHLIKYCTEKGMAEEEYQVVSDLATDLHTVLTSTEDNFGFLF